MKNKKISSKKKLTKKQVRKENKTVGKPEQKSLRFSCNTPHLCKTWIIQISGRSQVKKNNEIESLPK
jgi:hypothetical protein